MQNLSGVGQKDYSLQRTQSRIAWQSFGNAENIQAGGAKSTFLSFYQTGYVCWQKEDR